MAKQKKENPEVRADGLDERKLKILHAVIRNYLETGDISNVRMDSFFCRKQTQIFDYLFERICDSDFIDVVGKWIGV